MNILMVGGRLDGHLKEINETCDPRTSLNIRVQYDDGGTETYLIV